MWTPKAVDVLIVGGGPSGLSAALTLSRALYKTAIFDSGTYCNAVSHRSGKYREAARKELLERYDTNTIVQKKVKSVKKDGESGLFLLEDASGTQWTGKKLVLAVGVKDVIPDIPGYAEAWSTGIFRCLFCHGWEDRGAKSVGILAVDLLAMIPPITDSITCNAFQFTDTVTIYTNGSENVVAKIKPLVEEKGVLFDTRVIKSLKKEPIGAQVTINFEDGYSATKSFLVPAPKNHIDLEFAKDLNIEVTPSGGELKVTPPFNETTEWGCFAAGDISSMAKVVIGAITFGAFAATGIVKQLQMD